MRLVGREDRATLERYRHLKPASRLGGRRCGKRCKGTSHACTRESGHRGPHVAHDLLRRVVAVWEPDPPADPATTPSRRERPAGLRSRRPMGLGEALGKALKFLDEHAEEIALVVFFLAFVWFALDWLMIIMR